MWWLDDITDSIDMILGKLQEMVRDRDPLQSKGSQRVRHDLVTEQQPQICVYIYIYIYMSNDMVIM